jgi:hypothetical protein
MILRGFNAGTRCPRRALEWLCRERQILGLGNAAHLRVAVDGRRATGKPSVSVSVSVSRSGQAVLLAPFRGFEIGSPAAVILVTVPRGVRDIRVGIQPPVQPTEMHFGNLDNARTDRTSCETDHCHSDGATSSI